MDYDFYNESVEKRGANGRTIVMVTHDQGMANYADRIIRISDGVVTV